MTIMKDIPGFENKYAVTRDGKVWSYPKQNGGNYPGCTKGKWLKQTIIRGWLFCCLGASRRYPIHRLVAITYIQKVEGKNDVNHINGIKTDNRVENLEWVTRSENVKHAWKNGLRNPTPQKKKLTDLQASEIKKLHKKTKLTKILTDYNISTAIYYKIIKGYY